MVGIEKEANTSSKIRVTFVLIIIAATVVVTALIYVFVFAEKRPGNDAWEETTVPFDAGCESDCLSDGTLGSSHGSAPAEMLYNPAVDDPIAQWGDCLESIFTCVEADVNADASAEEKATIINTCVAASICPAQCTDKFSDRSGSSTETVMKAFEDVFIGPEAWCLPEDEL